MRSSRVPYIIISALLLFASCGRQHTAEQKVKDFVENNIESPQEISDRDFADIGITRHISDSLITVMRHRGAPLFKKQINYGSIPSGDLYYLRMKYIHKGDTLQNTFYLDSELHDVVAFK